MPKPSPVLRLLGVFALIYVLLIVPWPGWNAAYGAGFRWLGQTALGTSHPRVVLFRPAPAGSPLDTQIVAYDPAKADARGHVMARVLGLDTRGVGWIPTAFLAALILASPVPWPRRLRALCVGWTALYVYLAVAVRIYIWDQTMGDGSGALRAVVSGLDDTMVTQLGPSFVVPALLWLSVTFRQADFRAALDYIARRRL